MTASPIATALNIPALLDLGSRRFWSAVGRPIDLNGSESWLRPEVQPDGSLLLSSGRGRFGENGCYSVVSDRGGDHASHAPLHETLHLYVDDEQVVRADHHLKPGPGLGGAPALQADAHGLKHSALFVQQGGDDHVLVGGELRDEQRDRNRVGEPLRVWPSWARAATASARSILGVHVMAMVNSKKGEVTDVGATPPVVAHRRGRHLIRATLLLDTLGPTFTC